MEEKSLKIYNEVLKNIIYPFLGKKSTWGLDLTKLGNKLFKKNYAGTYSSNMIPDLGVVGIGGFFETKTNIDNISSDSKLYSCVNLDNSDEPGSHWIALAYDVYNGKIMIYDSFGRDTKIILPSLIEKYGKDNIVMSDDDSEQKIKEEDCGARCMAFLYVFDRFGSKYAKTI